MNQTVVDRLLPLVEAYALGRRHQKEAGARLREIGKCACGSDVVGCHALALPAERWCQPCRLREPIWQAFAERRRTNRELLRRVEVLGLRLSLPDAPPEPEEPRELLALMHDGEP